MLNNRALNLLGSVDRVSVGTFSTSCSQCEELCWTTIVRLGVDLPGNADEITVLRIPHQRKANALRAGIMAASQLASAAERAEARAWLIEHQPTLDLGLEDD